MKPWRTVGGERATHPANPPPRRSKEAPHRARAGKPELRTGSTAATQQTSPPGTFLSVPLWCRKNPQTQHTSHPAAACTKQSCTLRPHSSTSTSTSTSTKNRRSHPEKPLPEGSTQQPTLVTFRNFAASRLRVRSNTPQLPSAKQPRPSYSKNQRQQHVQIPTTDEAAKNRVRVRVRVRVRETRTSTPTHSSLSASISCANPAPAIIRANPCSSVAEKNPWLKNHPLIPVCSDRRRYLMRLTRLQQHSMVTHARRFYANHPRPLVITEIRHPTTLVNPRIPDHRRQ